MIKNKYHVIGVMSGTSLDGIDLCYAKFDKEDNWNFSIITADTLSYSKEWRLKLANASQLSSEEIAQLDEEYTTYLASIISKFIAAKNIELIDTICSHGHTVLHQPKEGFTIQIGNKPVLANILNQTIVCDFRVQDVQLGGQGAPLVPIGDALLFSQFDYCLNLGGFANVSFEKGNERIAFDICPVNTVLNFYAQKLNLPYDEDGAIARSGTIQKRLLEQLNVLEYYKRSYPKSLGIEWVNEVIFPLLQKVNYSNEDILATFVAHIAKQIGESINAIANQKILATGGGAYNGYLIECIKETTKAEVIIPSIDIIDNKEALIFGLLGVLRLRNEVNCLASVTGASKNHSSGKVFLPEKQT